MKESKGRSKNLLIKVRDEYDVKLVPVEVQHRENRERRSSRGRKQLRKKHLQETVTWADSYTKLLAFNQTQYDRVIAFDSDALLLQSMDELFFMPPCPIAMPRAYWLMKEKPPKKILSTHIMLLQPSEFEFNRLQNLIDNARDDEFDMELVNKLYGNSAAVLPHRPYALLTAEFRSKDHKMYLGTDVEKWDPQAIIDETKLVHFSDWPVPKPWVQDEEGLRRKHQPNCKREKNKEKNCLDREIWNSLYAEFMQRRKVSTCLLPG
jgi:alpha-N-acetylglucosamine transferase